MSERTVEFLIDTLFMSVLSNIVLEQDKIRRHDTEEECIAGIQLHHESYIHGYIIYLTFFDWCGSMYADTFRSKYIDTTRTSLTEIMKGLHGSNIIIQNISEWKLARNDIITEYEKRKDPGYLITADNKGVKIIYSEDFQ